MVSGHSGGEVLEVADGIANEEALGAVYEIPGEGLVGRGLIGDHRGFV